MFFYFFLFIYSIMSNQKKREEIESILLINKYLVCDNKNDKTIRDYLTDKVGKVLNDRKNSKSEVPVKDR